MEINKVFGLIVVAFLVESILGAGLETQKTITEYLGYRVTLPCKFSTGGNNDGWMFIRWKKTTDEGEVNLAVMQNIVLEPTWSDTAPANFKDHVELQKELGDDVYSLNLVIDGLTCADVGNYTCQVFTFSGDMSSTTTLDVLAHPGAPTIPSDSFEAKENDSFHLQCTANVGIPPSTITWSYSLKDQNIFLKITDGVVQTNTKGAGEQCSYHGKSVIGVTMEKKLDGAVFMCVVDGELGQTGTPSNTDTVDLVLYGKPTTPKTTTATTTLKAEDPDTGETGSAVRFPVSSTVILCCTLLALLNNYITRQS